MTNSLVAQPDFKFFSLLFAFWQDFCIKCARPGNESHDSSYSRAIAKQYNTTALAAIKKVAPFAKSSLADRQLKYRTNPKAILKSQLSFYSTFRSFLEQLPALTNFLSNLPRLIDSNYGEYFNEVERLNTRCQYVERRGTRRSITSRAIVFPLDSSWTVINSRRPINFLINHFNISAFSDWMSWLRFYFSFLPFIHVPAVRFFRCFCFDPKVSEMKRKNARRAYCFDEAPTSSEVSWLFA